MFLATLFFAFAPKTTGRQVPKLCPPNVVLELSVLSQDCKITFISYLIITSNNTDSFM